MKLLLNKQRRVLDLSGQVFGRLTVLGNVVLTPDGKAVWTCRCECGKEIQAPSSSLRTGNTKSCGCLKSDLARKRFTKNGGHKKCDGYNSWVCMKQRCRNPNNPDWGTYGALGISVHPDWLHDFHAFITHIGPRPSKKHSVDRIDTNGNYEPGNVRWAIPFVQNNNARSNVMIEHDGKRLNFTGWAREKGVHKDLIRQRVRAYGWLPDRAISTPVK